MYIVGHCYISSLTGLFSDREIYGSGIFPLLLPDYVRCHDWGYGHCFALPAGLELVQAHLLGDWFVHYGGAQTERRKKSGWAYANMAFYANCYQTFFAESARLGLRSALTPTESVRGFAHSMCEYTIDTYLARKGVFRPFFADVKNRLSRLGCGFGLGSLEWVRSYLAFWSIQSDSPDLVSDLASYRTRIAESEHEEEWAFRAGMRKFGLNQGKDSLCFMADYIDRGMARIGADEIEKVVADCAGFLLRWRINSAAADGRA